MKWQANSGLERPHLRGCGGNISDIEEDKGPRVETRLHNEEFG